MFRTEGGGEQYCITPLVCPIEEQTVSCVQTIERGLSDKHERSALTLHFLQDVIWNVSMLASSWMVSAFECVSSGFVLFLHPDGLSSETLWARLTMPLRVPGMASVPFPIV